MNRRRERQRVIQWVEKKRRGAEAGLASLHAADWMVSWHYHRVTNIFAKPHPWDGHRVWGF